MNSLANVLQYVNIVAFGVLALVCFRTWRRHRGDASFWAFATFGLLAAVALTGPMLDALDQQRLWFTKVVVALVVLFPYFLYRFATSFGRSIRWMEAAAAGAPRDGRDRGARGRRHRGTDRVDGSAPGHPGGR
jgi:ABC-type uncharacterized transport system permease subunit